MRGWIVSYVVVDGVSEEFVDEEVKGRKRVVCFRIGSFWFCD